MGVETQWTARQRRVATPCLDHMYQALYPRERRKHHVAHDLKALRRDVVHRIFTRMPVLARDFPIAVHEIDQINGSDPRLDERQMIVRHRHVV